MHAHPNISVVICTYNGAERLPETLRHLVAQDHPNYEIIVVDNNSDDETAGVVMAWQREHANLRYVFEGCQGLSYARNAGIEASRAPLIAFTDDDINAPPHWLAMLANGFAEDETIGGVGGSREVLFLGKQSALIQRSEQAMAYLGRFRPRTNSSHLLVGANMSFRKSALEDTGGFDVALGRSGERLVAHEDLDMCHRVREAGYTLVYLPDALVYHRVTSREATWSWVLKKAFGYSASKVTVGRGLQPTGLDEFHLLNVPVNVAKVGGYVWGRVRKPWRAARGDHVCLTGTRRAH